MNAQFPQNVQPPAGWTAQTYIDSTGNVQVGHTISPVWPFSVYPPLPPCHPMSAPTFPPGLAHGPTSPATGPALPPQKFSLPRSSNQSPIDNAAGPVPMYTPWTSKSYAPSASWNQLHPNSVYPPPFPSPLYSAYGGYYYPHQPQGQGSTYPTAAPLNTPLSNEAASFPHHQSSGSSESTATPLLQQEDACCAKQPTSASGLPTTYEFTFKCSPQLDSQQYCSPRPRQYPPDHSQDTLPTTFAEDQLSLFSSLPVQETSELQFDDLETFQGLLDAYIRQDAEEPGVPQQETSWHSCDAEPVTDVPSDQDKAAAQIIWAVLSGAAVSQDAASDLTASSSLENPLSCSPALSAVSSETQMSGSTSVSSCSHAGTSSKADSPSLPCSVPPQQGMFSAGPKATSKQRGKKRSMKTEHDNGGSEPANESRGSKRRRVAAKPSKEKRKWCTKCSEWVPEDKKTVHQQDPKHSGPGPYSCRICYILGIRDRRLSRKDSLKRHIMQQHVWQFGYIWLTFPQILEPHNSKEDLGYLATLLNSPQR